MSADIGDEAVALARGWIGTPYMHQASRRGVGCDCLGLIRGVWREVYGAEPEPVPAYTPDWSEASGDEALLRAGLRLMRQVGPDAPDEVGHILLFRMKPGVVAKHIGLRSSADRFIHAYEGCGVVEARLTPYWSRRIAARFAFPL